MNAIIFDFDGTIANSFDVVFAFLCHKAGKTARDYSPAEQQALHGLSMRDLALKVGIPKWRLPLVYFQGKADMARHIHKTAIFEGINDMLAALQAEDFKMFIISSNSKRNINRFVTQNGIGGYFLAIYGNAGWFNKSRTLKRALQQNGLLNTETMCVGDEVRDIVAAHAVGMPAIAVNWGFGSESALLKRDPSLLVRSVPELQKTLIDWGKTN